MATIGQVFSFLCTAALVAGQQWQQMPGSAIEISARGNELWAIDKDQNVLRYDGNKWVTIPFVGTVAIDTTARGRPISVGASADGWAWIATDGAHQYRYNPTVQKWENMAEGCRMTQISVMNKDTAFGLESTIGDLYSMSTTCLIYCKPNCRKGKWVSMSETGDKFFVSNDRFEFDNWHVPGDDGKLYKADPSANNAWLPIGGFATTIDAKNANRMVMTTGTGAVFIWNNGTWAMTSAENARRATISDTSVYILTFNEEIWYANI